MSKNCWTIDFFNRLKKCIFSQLNEKPMYNILTLSGVPYANSRTVHVVDVLAVWAPNLFIAEGPHCKWTVHNVCHL